MNAIPSRYHQTPPPFSFRCFFGWHRWTWRLARSDDDEERTVPLSLSDAPPPHATCERCGQEYEG